MHTDRCKLISARREFWLYILCRLRRPHLSSWFGIGIQLCRAKDWGKKNTIPECVNTCTSFSRVWLTQLLQIKNWVERSSSHGSQVLKMQFPVEICFLVKVLYPRDLSIYTTLIELIVCSPLVGRKGFLNLGASCYLNVVLQVLIHNPLIRQHFMSDKHPHQLCSKDICVCCEMDKLFTEVGPSVLCNCPNMHVNSILRYIHRRYTLQGILQSHQSRFCTPSGASPHHRHLHLHHLQLTLTPSRLLDMPNMMLTRSLSTY